MKFFVHIGTEKTGTTTIQSFLRLNREKLKRKGYIYTKSAGDENNRALPVAAYNQERRDDFTKANYINTNKDLLAFQDDLIKKIKDEISKANVEDPIFLFSSEHIQSRLTEFSEIQKLKEILKELGASDIYIIVYLRRPAEIANSLYSTALKSGHVWTQPPLPEQHYMKNLCDHKNTMQKFGAVFGDNYVIPRLYSKHELVNRSVIDDFLYVIGAKLDDVYAIPENKNISLSFLGTRLLRKINESIPFFINDKPNPFRSDLVSYIEDCFRDSKYCMPAHFYKLYDTEFHDSNEWLRKKYFPEKNRLFTDEITLREDKSKITDDEIEQIAHCISSIWNDKQKKLSRLSKK